MYSTLFGVGGARGPRDARVSGVDPAAAARASAPTVAEAFVGSAWASRCAGVRLSSTGASAAVCAKLSGTAAASPLAASSEAKRRWNEVIDHCCCLDLDARGAMVVMGRDLDKSALEGASLKVRAAVRRRNLDGGMSAGMAERVRQCLHDGEANRHGIGCSKSPGEICCDADVALEHRHVVIF